MHWSVIDGFVHRAADDGVVARALETSAELTEAARRAAALHAADSDYLDEQAMWTGGPRREDGVPAPNRPPVDQRDPLLHRAFDSGDGPAGPPRAETADGGGQLIVLCTAGDDSFSRLRAGEAASGMLLEATAVGLASCVVTEVLEVVETRLTVRDRLVVDATFPQVIVRIGWLPLGSPELPATPRRPVEDTVRMLDLGGDEVPGG